ncbi:MAG: response regulator, partial [Phycisphaerae bacterium]
MPTMSPAGADVLEGQQQARILVVDDEPEMAALMADLLSSADPTWRVESETDPTEALQRLTNEAFDCLVTDLVMPSLGGLSLAEQARTADAHLAIIAITGCGTLESSIEALRLRFDDFLEKPFDLEQMKQAVARSLETRRRHEQRDTRFAELAQAKTKLETTNAQVSQKLDIASHDLVLSTRRMARRLDEVSVCADVARTVMGIIELEDLLGLCAELAADRVPCDSCTVALYETQEHAVGLLVRTRPDSDDPAALSWLRRPLTSGVMCRAAQSSKTVHVESIAESSLMDEQEHGLWPDGRLLAVPIPLQGLSVGTIVLHREATDAAFGTADVTAVGHLAQVVGPAIQTAKLHHRQRCQIYASLEAIADGVEQRDGYLKGHAARVLAYAMPVGQVLELSQSQVGALQIAARLHDIGR